MPNKRGFTLIDLLVAIAIVALLVSILLPSIRQAKDMDKDMLCRTNLKAIYGGLGLYAEDYDGRLMKVDNEGPLWNHMLTQWPGGHYVPPIEYVESSDTFFCPSEVFGEWRNRLYDVSDAYHFATGDYGLNMAAMVWDTVILWKVKRPDKMYLMADCYTSCIDHYSASDDQYQTRHGNQDRVNMTYMDGHFGSLKPAMTPGNWPDQIVLRNLTYWNASLPWYNGEMYIGAPPY